MARKVEHIDSDSDLPDLAHLIKQQRSRRPDPRTDDQVTCQRTSSTSRAGSQPVSRAASLRPEIPDSEEDSQPEKETRRNSRVDQERPKPKRRILKQTSVNPLLRPISSTNVSVSTRVSASAVASEVSVSFPREGKTVARSKSQIKIPSRSLSKSSPRKVEADEDVFDDSDDGGMGDMISRFQNSTLEKQKLKAVRRERTKRVAAQFVLEEAEVDDGSEDEEDDDDSDGLSDFIVNDSYILTEDDSEAALMPPPPPPPPKSARKLVRGRRPGLTRNEDVDELGLELGTLSVGDGSRATKTMVEKDVLKEIIEILDTSEDEVLPKRRVPPTKTKKEKEIKRVPRGTAASSGVDEPLATLRFSPSHKNPRKISPDTRATTPPPSPSKKLLRSPKKPPPIPMTPHRPSMDAFWSQDIINDWNDEYSPKKQLKPKQLLDSSTELSEDVLHTSPKKSPPKQDRAAKQAKKTFSETKHALAESFLTEVDNKITGGKVSELAASTGGIKIIWSKKLNTTAGRANWKRETVRTAPTGPDRVATVTYRHHAAIELAEKVIDDEDRLLNVLAHEFCHLANFMISNVKTNPHGKEFKAWAAQCSRAFGDRGIEVTTKHSYAIDYKYVWECEHCGAEFKRHSKSIDPARHQCGSCRCKLVQTKPVPKSNGVAKVSEYQVFVKENLKKVRGELPSGSPQKDIMGEVGRRYQQHKASRLGQLGEVAKSSSPDVAGDVDDNLIGAVSRKLDFLDLTGP
ncbi:sprt family metallopeptidase [Phlyctema vagabunda]|uniref:Sprt family metallopeptidase n=1 Tax=Phlyctema vagabunda TaxID=108571 RepID=A0ABR4PSM3_9HELO